MRITLMLVVALALCGCTQPQTINPGDGDNAISKITYSKDPKTGICFALLGSTGYSGYVIISLTTIPCDKMPEAKP